MTDAVLHRLGGEGPDVLLIHGFGADRMSWLAVASQMFETATLWAVEYAGHGGAGNDVGDGTPQSLAAAIETAICGALTRPIIVGHSLGGTVALHLAASATADISGLLLLAPAGVSGQPDSDFIDILPELEDGEFAPAYGRRLCRDIAGRRAPAGAAADCRGAAIGITAALSACRSLYGAVGGFGRNRAAA
ncbi:MAG: alpha/beta fold hydrolase [Candidatus Puniceispirillaceae bacterium]